MRTLAAVLLLLVASACSSLSGRPEDLDVEFVGNGSLSERSLLRAAALDLQDFVREGNEPAYVDDASFSMEEAYRSAGFPFAAVLYELLLDGPRPRVRFEVQEGARVRLDTVRVVRGELTELSPDEVTATFQVLRGSLLSSRVPVYVASVVNAGPGRLLGELRARGFRDARVTLLSGPPEPGQTEAVVELEVHQGRRYTVRDVLALDTQTEVLVPDWAGLRRAFLVERDAEGSELGARRLTPRLEFELRGEVLGRLADAGYPDARAEIEVRVDEQEAQAVLALRVDPGPRVRVGQVLFEGDEETWPRFLRKRSDLRADRVAYQQEIQRALTRLYRTGFYSRVSQELRGSGADRDLVVHLEPRDTLETFVEPGYGSYEKLRVRAGLRERNFLGSGNALRVEGTLAQRARRAVIGLTDPWLVGANLIGDLSVEYSERDLPSFTSVKTGFGAFVTREWDERGRIATSFGYQYRNSTSKNVVVDLGSPTADAELQENVDISSLKLTQLYDRRTSRLLPTGGYELRGDVEFGSDALGSDLDFVRYGARAVRILRLRSGTRLVAAARAGVIQPTAGQVVPLQERYFNGGENTVRSFMENRLGPTDAENNPVGGEAWSVFNLELRQDLQDTNLHGALFLDVGNVTLEAEDFFRFEDLRTGIGVGLRYMLPVGPARLDFAVNPDAGEQEDDWVVHFSIGLPF